MQQFLIDSHNKRTIIESFKEAHTEYDPLTPDLFIEILECWDAGIKGGFWIEIERHELKIKVI